MTTTIDTATVTKRHRWPTHPKDPARPNLVPCRNGDRCLDCGMSILEPSPRPPCTPLCPRCAIPWREHAG